MLLKSAFWKLVLEIPIFGKEASVLTINIQRWKDKFLPIFCLWANFISSFGSKENNWMTLLWCTRTSPCRGSSPQDVHYQTFEIHSKSQKPRSHLRSELGVTWGRGCPRGQYFFWCKCPLNDELPYEISTRVNQHPPAHHVGWMTCEYEALFPGIHKS